MQTKTQSACGTSTGQGGINSIYIGGRYFGHSLQGGLGVIHKNMNIEEQARQVHTVKKYESGIVRNPITVTPDMSIREVIDLTRAMGISGVPVVSENQTVGIVTGKIVHALLAKHQQAVEAPGGHGSTDGPAPVGELLCGEMDGHGDGLPLFPWGAD